MRWSKISIGFPKKKNARLKIDISFLGKVMSTKYKYKSFNWTWTKQYQIDIVNKSKPILNNLNCICFQLSESVLYLSSYFFVVIQFT